MRTTRQHALIVMRAFVLAICVFGVAEAQTASPPKVPVTTATVIRRDVPVIVRTIGTVQPFQTVVVKSRVDGSLDNVFFTEGQYVKPGDLLAQLDPRPYQAVLDQMLAKKAADEAMLANNRADLIRYAELASSQVASRQKLDQSKAAVAQAEANVRGDEASITAAQLALSFTRITAPIEGRVGLRLLDPGNLIRVADNNAPGIVAIAQIRPIALLFTLPQDTLPQVQAAMRRGKVPVIAYTSDDKARLGEGELLTIDSSIDTNTGTIRLKAMFANTDDALWPGQFINVRVQLDIRHGAPTVPVTAVQRGRTAFTSTWCARMRP